MEMIKMSDNNVVVVKILRLPGASAGCSCGTVASPEEMAAMFQQKITELQAALEEAYPGRTRVEPVNLKENQAERETEIGQLLVTKKYPPPLVVINGEPKFAGSIQVKKIVQEVGNLLG
jgi:disulfide oxidoreductase YuzD